MPRLTFFARPSFLGNAWPGLTDETRLMRIHSRIRGEQMARYLGVKFNPKEGFEDDLCIYVKPRHLRFMKEHDWVDIGDEWTLIKFVEPHTQIIAISQHNYDFLVERFPENKIIIIPHQHVNWENAPREKRKVKVGGYLGGISNVALPAYQGIQARLKKLGFDFIFCFNFKNRQDNINFYQSIDFLVIGVEGSNSWCGTPAKLINAASFSKPAVAFKQDHYKEFEGNYIPISSLDEMEEEVLKFNNEDYYEEWSLKVREAAEPYHISKIADMYLQLEKEFRSKL